MGSAREVERSRAPGRSDRARNRTVGALGNGRCVHYNDSDEARTRHLRTFRPGRGSSCDRPRPCRHRGWSRRTSLPSRSVAFHLGNPRGNADTARMVEIIWSIEATSALVDIRTYIAEFNPEAAASTARRLRDAASSLAQYPDRGRPASDGTRELVTVPPYIIHYEHRDAIVTILRVRHGRRRPMQP